jgi:hypothetical protein
VKVQLILTDDDANTFEGVVTLTPSKVSAPATGKSKAISSPNHPNDVDLSLPIRAFVKKHGRAMSGAQRFTLLVAHMTCGDRNKEVLFSDIQRQWNKMTGLLGGKFNNAHSIRARERGWVDSPRKGAYVTLPGWRGIFGA